MRETKFKAWDKRHNKWIKEEDFVVLSNGKGHIVKIDSNVDSDEDIELIEFTGLKDKNEKEIYEGDVLNGQTGWGKENLIVEYHPPKFMLRTPDGLRDFESGNTLNFEKFYSLHLLEVISNIYENPELIRKVED